jgi:recombination protein RecT
MSTEKKETGVVVKQKEITALVLDKINAYKQSGELKLPSDYSPENALKAAYLVLSEAQTRDKKPVLQACTQASIANSLLKMVVWGVSPLKGQIYFVPYADKLDASISYTGNILMAKRFGNLKTIKANCILDGDDFEFAINPETGRKQIVKHTQTLKSIGSEKILGAYAVYELNDGTKDVEIMNMEQIKKSWNQGATNGGSPAHKNFPDQMSMRTVLNRACKLLIRTSDDSPLYSKDDLSIDTDKEDLDYVVKNNANQETIDIDAIEVKDEEVLIPTEDAAPGESKPLF